MTWGEWREALLKLLARQFGSEREMYDDGLSPEDAVTEEDIAAAWLA